MSMSLLYWENSSGPSSPGGTSPVQSRGERSPLACFVARARWWLKYTKPNTSWRSSSSFICWTSQQADRKKSTSKHLSYTKWCQQQDRPYHQVSPTVFLLVMWFLIPNRQEFLLPHSAFEMVQCVSLHNQGRKIEATVMTLWKFIFPLLERIGVN